MNGIIRLIQKYDRVGYSGSLKIKIGIIILDTVYLKVVKYENTIVNLFLY